VQIALAVAELQDRIGDQLAGAVIGDIAAALDLDDLDIARSQEIGQRALPASDGDDVRVLDDEQRVARLAPLPRRHLLELARVRLAVAEAAEIDQIAFND
jgi:hypothetical protein